MAECDIINHQQQQIPVMDFRIVAGTSYLILVPAFRNLQLRSSVSLKVLQWVSVRPNEETWVLQGCLCVKWCHGRV